MGVLAPLFLAGLTALSLPLILHLVRRTPRGRQLFSSLMFLAPTPPKLTRRSRLDQLFLLMLRLTALGLLAFAFARPFLREAASLTSFDLPGRRVALLVDASASMRRGDLWKQAMKLAEQEIADLNPQDDIALFTFDDRLHTNIDFDKDGVPPVTAKPQVVRNRLKELKPTWDTSDLGTALVALAGDMDAAGDVRQSSLEPHIVVISDFQKGSRLEALQAFEWPARVSVVCRTVTPAGGTNAFAHVLIDEAAEETADLRVRVVNAADSSGEQFYLAWSGDPARVKKPPEIAVHVPPGQSRVVRMPRTADTLEADRIVLRGDDHDFDNTHYVVPLVKRPVTVLYAGTDALDDQRGLPFYLRLATANDPLRQVDVKLADAAKPLLPPGEPVPELVVVSRVLAADQQSALKGYIERGGTLLLVPLDQTGVEGLTYFYDDVEVPANPAKPASDYLLFGELDFQHPLFAPFAGPRYGDFTKIHFWKHRAVSLKTPAVSKVLARFDNGDPAMIERTPGTGRVLALTSGWNPDDSQLALSSKFVPLIGNLLDLACHDAEIPVNITIGAPVALASSRTESSLIVHKPNTEKVTVDKDREFKDTSEPGIYRAIAGDVETRFAVNLAAAESNTTPLNLDQLQQLGVRFGDGLTSAERIDRVRQQRDTELEARQKVWRWLIAAALFVLIVETWWAGRAEHMIRSESLTKEVLA